MPALQFNDDDLNMWTEEHRFEATREHIALCAAATNDPIAVHHWPHPMDNGAPSPGVSEITAIHQGETSVVCDHTVRADGRRRLQYGRYRRSDEHRQCDRSGPDHWGHSRRRRPSAGIDHTVQFAGHASRYQAVGTQAAAIHELVVTTLGTGGGTYAATEDTNAAAL